MKTILHDCPTAECGKQHALIWFVGKGGKKRLGIFCDRATYRRVDKADDREKLIRTTSFISVEIPDAVDLSGIPEHLTGAAKKELALKAQEQLPIMNIAPGQKVERNVDLPRDNSAIAKLQVEIDMRLQSCKEIDDKIAALENRKRDIKEKAHKLSEQLSELQTEPLKLK